MSRPNKARRRTPFDSVESLVHAVRDVCRREYNRDHGFPWPWEEMPEQEWTLVTPDKTVEGPEIRKKIEECAEEFLACAARAYDIARQSNSVSAASLKRLADAVLRSPVDDLMYGGKVAVGREFIVSTARGNEWATGVSASPRQLTIVSLLCGNWPSQMTPKNTVAEVIAQEAKAIRLWLQRSKPLPRGNFTYSLNVAGAPPTQVAWSIYVTQVIQAGTYAIFEALHRYYEAHPEAERPAGYTAHRDPPRDLASLLATRPQQQAARQLLSPLLVADETESGGVSEALEILDRLLALACGLGGRVELACHLD